MKCARIGASRITSSYDKLGPSRRVIFSRAAVNGNTGEAVLDFARGRSCRGKLFCIRPWSDAAFARQRSRSSRPAIPLRNLVSFPPRFPPTPRVVLLRIGSFRGCPERSIADIVEPPLGFGVGLVSLSPRDLASKTDAAPGSPTRRRFTKEMGPGVRPRLRAVA